MKRALLNILIFTSGCLLLSSCYNKRYDCECIDSAQQVFMEDVISSSRKRADDKCRSLEISGKFKRTTVCTLK